MDSAGYYVEPTIIEAKDPKHRIMQEVCLPVEQLITDAVGALAELQASKHSRINCISTKIVVRSFNCTLMNNRRVNWH